MKRRYRIGDKVRIKHILAKDSDRYHFGINPAMEQYDGRILTIDEIEDEWVKRPEDVCYRMKEDEHLWSWSISMFTSVEKGFVDLELVI